MACESLFLWLKKVKPYLAVVSLQFGYAGMFIITTVSLKNGMSHFVLSVYRHAIATAVIAPFALALERKTMPKMTFPIFWRIMVLGFLEPVLGQNLYNLGMKYTSATFASATVNTLPAVTFVMAIIFRLEKVNVKKMSSLAKMIGTAVTVTGALLMTLYKGPVVDIIWSKGIGHSHGATATASDSGDKQWVVGTLMLLASSFGWAGFFILQSFTLKKYPAPLSLTTLICLMGALEGAAVTLVFEHDMSVWLLGWDSKLLAVVYSGVVCSAIAYYVQGSVMRERGPVFVTAFSPLCMVITAAMGVIILAETLYLGSIVGAIVTGVGLYIVVWGMSKQYKSSSIASLNDEQEIASAHKLPITVIKFLEDRHYPLEATNTSMMSDRRSHRQGNGVDKTRGTTHKGSHTSGSRLGGRGSRKVGQPDHIFPRSAGPTTVDLAGISTPLISHTHAGTWLGSYYGPEMVLDDGTFAPFFESQVHRTFQPFVNTQVVQVPAAEEPHISPDHPEVDDLDEDEVDDEGHPLPRDKLGRVLLVPSGINSFIDYKAGANRISSIVMSHVNKFYPHPDGGPMHTWGRVPKRGQDMMFREWKRRVFWNPKHEEYFVKAFHFWAQKLLGDMLRHARRNDAKPHWIGDDHWAKMKEKWEWKRIMDQNKVNQASNEGSSLYTADCIPFVTHASRGSKKLGRPKGSLDLFRDMHKEAADHAWVHPKVANEVEGYDERASRQTDSPRSQQEVALLRADQVTRTSKKGRVRGMNWVLSRPPSDVGGSSWEAAQTSPEHNEQVENDIANLKAMQAKQQQDMRDILSAQKTLINMVQGLQGHYLQQQPILAPMEPHIRSRMQPQMQHHVHPQTQPQRWGSYGQRMSGVSRMQAPRSFKNGPSRQDAWVEDDDEEEDEEHDASTDNDK